MFYKARHEGPERNISHAFPPYSNGGSLSILICIADTLMLNAGMKAEMHPSKADCPRAVYIYSTYSVPHLHCGQTNGKRCFTRDFIRRWSCNHYRQRCSSSSAKIQGYLRQRERWNMKANEKKIDSNHSHKRARACPPVLVNACSIPQKEEMKYLSIHLNRKLIWKNHITIKR